MFFKGFVETKNKKCIEKFKGRTDFKTFEQVQSLPEYAGILAADTILVDIDDSETSEILFKVVQEYALTCRVYRTSRGKHFLFKNSGVPTNKTGCKLAIGLTADIKIGTRNSYEVLKYGGKEREILYDTAENEEAQPLPRWLHPVKSNMEFLNMDAGDGRNQSLFNYILTLQSNDFSVEEARETIRIINKFVLKVPLSDDEIETILRDDAFKKPVFFMGSTFLFDMPNRFPEGFIDTLKEKGFFTAPASIHHHGAYSGALFDHSLAVANSLLSLTKRLELKWQDGRSPLIVGMFHDFCKVDNYTKTDNEAWEYNNATLLPGHGDKSVIMLQQYMQLTEEEMLCIRWHMGAFDDKENWNSYGRSVTLFPNVLYTHTADMIAARILGV